MQPPAPLWSDAGCAGARGFEPSHETHRLIGRDIEPETVRAGYVKRRLPVHAAEQLALGNAGGGFGREQSMLIEVIDIVFDRIAEGPLHRSRHQPDLFDAQFILEVEAEPLEVLLDFVKVGDDVHGAVQEDVQASDRTCEVDVRSILPGLDLVVEDACSDHAVPELRNDLSRRVH